MASNWFITDDDCLQCCNGDSLGTGTYEFVQINSYGGHIDGKPFFQVAHGYISLSDYTEEEKIEALNLYGYENMDDLVLKNNSDGEFVFNEDGTVNSLLSPGYDSEAIDTANQLLAEMFFEIETQEYVTEEFDSWNKAASHVCSIVNLDLFDYYEKTDNDFILLADPDTKSLEICTLGEFPKGFFPEGETVRRVPGCIPEYAVHYFNKGLSELKESYDISSYSISQKAKEQLPSLMEPILQADIDRNRHMFPILAIQWAKEHEWYVQDLDKVFSTLGFIQVERIRPSVTQGEVAVFFNGEKIIQYGDDIKLHSKDRDGIFDAVCTNQPLYGTIISGWGSTKPDSLFRQAALTQYCTDIVRTFEKNKSLDAQIQNAAARVLPGISQNELQKESER